MKSRRLISIFIVVAFCISVPGRAYADRVDTTAVTQVFVSNHRTPELRIRPVSDNRIPVFDFAQNGNRESIHAHLESESLLFGVGFSSLAQPQDPQKTPLGDVDVAICDCGDVLVPVAGGFPKWPLVFLAGIPFFFIKGGEDVLPPIDIPTPPSTPSLTPTPSIPEPASLILLLTGLGAVGLRLRKSRRAQREAKDDAE
jgi:hypothetical protein